PRTDLYAVGVVMFEMLTGRPPFAGETSLAIAYQHLTAEVPPPSFVVPSVPEDLDRLVRWATEKDRSARPASAKALAREVRRAAPSLQRASSVTEVAATARLEEPEEDRATTVTIPKLAPPAPRRRRRRGWLALGLVAVIALLAGSAWGAWAFLVPHHTTVPNVAGMTLQSAETRLVRAGLRVSTGPGVYSQTIPPNQVVRTQPASGVRVEKRAVIRLIPSLGRQLLPVPRVEGKREAAAIRILRRAGFQPNVKRAYDDEVPKSRVIRQSAEAGNRLERDARVTITVSRGPAPIEIPDVSGRPVDEAKLTLETLGFKVRQAEEFSTSVPRGEVIRTQPKAGNKALPRSEVTLVISRGPRVFAMPNVVGMTVASAQQTLEGLGLRVHVERLVGFSGDTVKLQRPDPDARVHEGDEVSIYA
ncbi:MAG TPA: PASTA domain-containing protein, partial [Actinomycetota bacterium]